jgi:predicted ATP-dependent protease
LQAISDLLREADYWAADEGAGQCEAKHIQQAIDAQIHRLDRIRSQQQEAIQRNTILIDTDGERVGQVNGLSVLQLGNFSFGQPSRITATVRLGGGKIIDIERETELGGPIHSKSVLIVASYLGSR